MPKTKISEYSTTNSANTDIGGINIDEGCAPSNINNAIREVMVQLKNFQTGASGDPFTFAGGVLISGTTNTISGASIISGNINSSGTNTFSGSQIISGNINSSGSTNTFSGSQVISGNINSSGTNTFSGTTVMSGANTIAYAAGTVSAPSITVNGDTNTGIYFPAADTIAFTEGGVEAMRLDSNGNVRVEKAARATITTDNDGSFDMNAASNFSCTPTGSITLTFTNITSGQSGFILLVNGSNYTVSAAATTKVASGALAAMSATGTYLLSYFSNGTNVFVVNSGALS